VSRYYWIHRSRAAAAAADRSNLNTNHCLQFSTALFHTFIAYVQRYSTVNYEFGYIYKTMPFRSSASCCIFVRPLIVVLNFPYHFCRQFSFPVLFNAALHQSDRLNIRSISCGGCLSSTCLFCLLSSVDYCDSLIIRFAVCIYSLSASVICQLVARDLAY
jgi:hypothetical protein